MHKSCYKSICLRVIYLVMIGLLIGDCVLWLPDALEEADEKLGGGVWMTMVGLIGIRVSLVVSDRCEVHDEGDAKGDEVLISVISKS